MLTAVRFTLIVADVARLEYVPRRAKFACHRDLPSFVVHVAQFFAAETFKHVEHPFPRAPAKARQGLGAGNPHAFLMEQP